MADKELEQSIHKNIVELCNKGEKCLEDGNYKEALMQYKSAFSLVPEPKYNWEASTWILTAIADTYFFSGNYVPALEVAEYLMHCPDAIGNPYVHLRKGEIHYELEQFEIAADELARAYMGGGKDIFAQSDKKYFEFIASKLKDIEED